MKVLYIGSVFPSSENDDQVPWMRQTCRLLRQSGCEVEYLAPSLRGISSHLVDGMRVHRFRYAPAKWETLTGEEGGPSKLRRRPFVAKLLALSYLWNGFWALTGLLFRNKYDLVEVHWPWPHGLIALPALWAGVPVVYHYHSAELKLCLRSKPSTMVLRWLMKGAKKHIANSSYTGQLVKQILPSAEVEVVAYGSPLDLGVSDAPQKTKLRKILFVGRHIERKGINFLIDAMRLLPEEYSLTIVGVGDLTDSLKLQAADLSGRVVFAGRLSSEELAAAYAASDLFVLPAIVDSRGDTEGLGVVLIEAVAASLPIVASNVGGIPDVVVDRQTGLLVPQRDCVALSQAIQKLGDDANWARQLAQNAHAHAQRYFGWENIIKQLTALYKSVVRKTS